MGDTLITVVAIFLAAVLMFVFPLMSVSERADDVSQLSVQAATVEYVDNMRTTGKITMDDYSKFIQTIGTTGNTYDVEVERKILDENPSKKTTQTNLDVIGENVYYTEYTTQIMDSLKSGNDIAMKEGDIVSVKVKNTNTTIAQLLRNVFYRTSDSDTYQIAGQHSGIVTVNGRVN